MLPGLLEELTVAVHTAPDGDEAPLFALLSEACTGATAIAYALGYFDLRSLAMERVEWAARRSDDPLRVVRTRWGVPRSSWPAPPTAAARSSSTVDLALDKPGPPRHRRGHRPHGPGDAQRVRRDAPAVGDLHGEDTAGPGGVGAHRRGP
ncbi:hypothetical protein GWI34_07290 [Actinomadura sp. DSM 109109]|nr:hypothetical protein [Actinomadura lepetitiana]